MKTLFSFFLLASPLIAGQPMSYNNLPLGDEKDALVLRSYMPDPGLPDAYFAHHGKASVSPHYNPATGKDVAGVYTPISGLPAAVGVNFGAALSYVFDTVECRLAYAWQGGFLDMNPYWGSKEGGGRRSFDYVPRLVGNLF